MCPLPLKKTYIAQKIISNANGNGITLVELHVQCYTTVQQILIGLCFLSMSVRTAIRDILDMTQNCKYRYTHVICAPKMNTKWMEKTGKIKDKSVKMSKREVAIECPSTLLCEMHKCNDTIWKYTKSRNFSWFIET